MQAGPAGAILRGSVGMWRWPVRTILPEWRWCDENGQIVDVRGREMISLVTACSHYDKVYDPAGSKEHRAIR